MDQAFICFEQYLMRQFNHSSTAKHYLSDLQIFLHTIGRKPPQEITPLDIDRFVESQITAGLKATTINRRLASLHTFFEYLAGEDLTQEWSNPIIWRRHRLKAGTQLPRDIPDDEVVQLFNVIHSIRDRAIFGLMVGAGLRVGEVVTLRLGSLEKPADPTRFAKLRVHGKGSKERIVWLTTTLWDELETWLVERPPVNHDYLFFNHHGHPLSVSGVQYRLKQYCEITGVTLSCHRLRHTFARRLVENGLPVESLARLLGHSQLDTTQRYIDGADPTLRAEFITAMSRLESNLTSDRVMPESAVTQPKPPPQSRTAPQSELDILRQKLDRFPDWLKEAVDAYLSWRWSTWRSQTAYQLGHNFINTIQQIWKWLAAHRQVESWETLRRADIEAWLQARVQNEVSNTTIQNNLGQFRSLLRFLENHDYPIDPGLFRIKPPQKEATLPRYLPEPDYLRLEATIIRSTESDTYSAIFDRAWFLTLAHTGIRISELLDWRLGDLYLVAGTATIRGSKPGRDRTVYLTPPLTKAISRYLDVRPNLPDNDHVFLLHERSPTARTIQRRLSEYGQQIGIQVSPHRLRHTLATRLVNQGVPIHSIQKLLGHRSLTDTQIYAHIYDQTLYRQFQAAISTLEAIPIEDWPVLYGVEVQ